jgi:hypothetical protein
MSQLTNLDALLLNNNELIGGIPVGFDLLTNLCKFDRDLELSI